MRRASVALLSITMVVFAANPAAADGAFEAQVTDVTTTSARLAWTLAEDPCFEEYRVQFREAGTSAWRLASVIGNAAANVTWVNGLEPGVAYEARVVRVDCNGWHASNTAPLLTQVPVQPGTGYSFGLLSLFGVALAGLVAAEVRFGGSLFRGRGQR